MKKKIEKVDRMDPAIREMFNKYPHSMNEQQYNDMAKQLREFTNNCTPRRVIMKDTHPGTQYDSLAQSAGCSYSVLEVYDDAYLVWTMIMAVGTFNFGEREEVSPINIRPPDEVEYIVRAFEIKKENVEEPTWM
jgi:hypothetical protein